ncbi:hypothetical protein DL771_009430 [Monosporascus sp. 5C6A]|nr:hypothetical protein DL771_009430 [Monosporascus sp. 5C6A]
MKSLQTSSWASSMDFEPVIVRRFKERLSVVLNVEGPAFLTRTATDPLLSMDACTENGSSASSFSASMDSTGLVRAFRVPIGLGFGHVGLRQAARRRRHRSAGGRGAALAGPPRRRGDVLRHGQATAVNVLLTMMRYLLAVGLDVTDAHWDGEPVAFGFHDFGVDPTLDRKVKGALLAHLFPAATDAPRLKRDRHRRDAREQHVERVVFAAPAFQPSRGSRNREDGMRDRLLVRSTCIGMGPAIWATLRPGRSGRAPTRPPRPPKPIRQLYVLGVAIHQHPLLPGVRLYDAGGQQVTPDPPPTARQSPWSVTDPACKFFLVYSRLDRDVPLADKREKERFSESERHLRGEVSRLEEEVKTVQSQRAQLESLRRRSDERADAVEKKAADWLCATTGELPRHRWLDFLKSLWTVKPPWLKSTAVEHLDAPETGTHEKVARLYRLASLSDWDDGQVTRAVWVHLLPELGSRFQELLATREPLAALAAFALGGHRKLYPAAAGSAEARDAGGQTWVTGPTPITEFRAACELAGQEDPRVLRLELEMSLGDRLVITPSGSRGVWRAETRTLRFIEAGIAEPVGSGAFSNPPLVARSPIPGMWKDIVLYARSMDVEIWWARYIAAYPPPVLTRRPHVSLFS